uniref:polyamine-modulated factor 1-binding protein 1-like isoform X2 n=1 Tax=Monopterus albus TaxID=43700 RepID=UPI0009B2F985|nr:polyamine-modulated factor 1-binding protein 1-like isoform X2 [Monopterus albus]
MDVPEEIITPKEMLERIAELDYSQNQLRDLNAEMRRWLDVADDDMAALRLENADLRKQTKALEKIISEARQVETDPWGALLADDLDVKKCSEKNIQKLEEEVTMMKEQNKKLTAELKSLQQEREQGKISLSKCSTALQTLECGMKEAQSELQRRDEIIHQKDFLLKFSEEMIDEYTNIIKELRLKNQELTKQLEDRQDEATLSAVNGLMEQKEGSLTSPVSFAEEVRLLRSSIEMEPSMSDFTHLRHEETETEALLKAETLTMRLPTKSHTHTHTHIIIPCGFSFV